MSEVKRKKNESFEAFMRRVKLGWKRSGKILQARKVQFFTPTKSKNVQKNRTITKLKMVSKTNYLRKTGRLPHEDDNKKQRRR